ncbi:MAG TPA: MFS transporter [Nakamurella sp.]|nr:MFS transporter [Nakamurella sp.]
MTDTPSGPVGPADEQRTTALPRRPAGGGPPVWPRPDEAAFDDASSDPSHDPSRDLSNETTALRRPPAGGVPQPPPISNLPGAGRRPLPPPGPPFGSPPSGRRTERDPRGGGGYRGADPGPPGGYPGDGVPERRFSRGDDSYAGDRDDAVDPPRGFDDRDGAQRRRPEGRRGGTAGREFPRGRDYPGDSGYRQGHDRGYRDDREYYQDEPGYRDDRGYDPDFRDGSGYREGRGYQQDYRDGSGYRDDRAYPRDDRDDRPRRDRRADRRGDDDHDQDYDDRDRRRPPDPDRSGRAGHGRGEPWPEDDESRYPRRHTAHLPPYREPFAPEPDDHPTPAEPPAGLGGRSPRKLTVTRVAALRSRELTHRGIERFHGAVSADGADRSGLTHLTYAVMGNYAVDAALAVALANTLFFAAAKAESTGKVLLYLLLTVAPFAIIAPFIGPLLDRLQNGRRIALAASSFGRALLALIMAIKFDSWVIYPCALGMLVLSKSFGVLKAALTPRVLPEAITLVKTNSRLSVFGLIAGGVSGGIAAGIAALVGSAGALGFTTAVALVGGWLCLRIPGWVESTEGEVPVRHSERRERGEDGEHGGHGARHRVLPREVAGTLWTNGTIRVETGFLALFIAFVVKSEYQSSSVIAPVAGTAVPPPPDHAGLMQLLLLGAVGAAAGVGGFLGNALGARLPLRAPQTVALVCLASVIAAVLLAFLIPGLITAGVVALVGSTASSLAKVCLDSTIQQHLPEVSRASAFGRSESVLQLSWVFGGVIGLLIGGVWALGGQSVYMVGFGIVGLMLLAGGAQCVALRIGHSLLPAVSVRSLFRRRRRHDTAPIPRLAGPAPAAGGGPSITQPARDRGSADPRSGTRRTARKAGRPR